MNKSRIFTIVGALLPLLIVLGLGSGCQPTQGGAQSPMRTPTAPSENWPTLTPPPTLPLPPTSPVTLKPTSIPTPTRPVVDLAPIPEGKKPTDLWGLYYMANTETVPELRSIEIDSQGQRWAESKTNVNMPDPFHQLYLSPSNKYLAGGGTEIGSAIYIIERTSGRTWCPLGERGKCIGRFIAWIDDSQFLFQTLMENRLEDVILKGILVINIDTGTYKSLDLPTSPDGLFSYVQHVSLSPDNHQIAYAVTYAEKQKEISEIWTMSLENGEKQLLITIGGAVDALACSPNGKQLAYIYRPGSLTSAYAPSELWLMNADGTGKTLLANQTRNTSGSFGV